MFYVGFFCGTVVLFAVLCLAGWLMGRSDAKANARDAELLRSAKAKEHAMVLLLKQMDLEPHNADELSEQVDRLAREVVELEHRCSAYKKFQAAKHLA